MFLPPERSALGSSSEEIKYCTDSTYMTMDVELVPMLVSPFLLLGGGHANPE